MDFKCLPNHHKFSFEPPDDKKGILWHWRGEIHCPMCGTIELEEVMVVSGAIKNTSRDLESARRENRMRTQESMAMASRARQESEERDPTVRLNDVNGSNDRYSGGVNIKKSTLDKIEKMAEAALDLTPPK